MSKKQKKLMKFPSIKMEKTALVAINESIVELDVQNQLEDLGFCVDTNAPSTEDLVSHARNNDPDLIILDSALYSHRNGCDGIDAVKEINQFSSVPVVLLTSSTARKTVQRIEDLKYSRHLFKPFSTEDLISTIASLQCTLSKTS